jgi:hypothetical protein
VFLQRVAGGCAEGEACEGEDGQELHDVVGLGTEYGVE